jgi:hypothetical protein
MSKKTLFLSLAIAVLLSSCSHDDMFISDQQNESKQSYASTKSDSILSFDNIGDYQNLLNCISALDTDEEKLLFVKNRYPKFHSIQTRYWSAMNEMDSIDTIDKNTYTAFEGKYNCLYFPKYKDDAGFYIPMSDLNAAFLANEKCEIKIGNKLVNLKDVTSYNELQQLGRAYYPEEMIHSRATPTTFNLNSASMNSVGPEYDSDWKTYGNRKVKLKARRQFVKTSVSVGFVTSTSLLHLEFCFRKNTWMGWVNYKSKSTIKFETTIPHTNKKIEAEFTHNGLSSHDSKLRYPIHIANNGTSTIYTFAETTCYATIDYRGVSEPLTYEWSMPWIQCVTSNKNNPIRIIPTI